MSQSAETAMSAPPGDQGNGTPEDLEQQRIQQQIQQLQERQQQLKNTVKMVQETTGREVTQEEVSSLISRIQQLEEANKSKEARIERLQQTKAQEMGKIVDDTIMKWVNDLQFKDEETKSKFIDGAQKIAKNANDESGAWEIMCLASASHIQNVNKIDELQKKVNSYESKERMLRGGGVFREESDRVVSEHDSKRRALSTNTFEPIPGGTGSSFAAEEEPFHKRDVWSEIESMMTKEHMEGIQTSSLTHGQKILNSL